VTGVTDQFASGMVRELACPLRGAFAARVICRFTIVFILGLVAVRGAAPGLKIISDVQQAGYETGEILLKGKVELRDESMVLTADEVTIDRRQERASAVGHVVLTQGATRVLADRLVFNRIDGSFEAENIRLGNFPFYAEGFSAYGTREKITVSRPVVTYGEPGRWRPTLKADTIVYSPGQRLQSENSQLGIGRAQPFPFPKFDHNLSDSFLAYASLNAGYRGQLGALVEVGLHLPVAKGILAGGDVGFYSRRGVMVGPGGSYAFADADRSLRGRLRTGYIKDHGDRDVDVLGRRVPEDRAYVEWQHEQRVNADLTLMAQVNWWRDSEIVRDFRPRNFFPVQEPDTFVEAVHTGANYFVTAFARLQPNSFHRAQERLPEIRFDLLPYAIGNGFYERFNASVAMLREDPPLAGPALRSNRLDAYYALIRPFMPRDWFTFTPVAGARVTHYTNTLGAQNDGTYTRTLGEVGADMALRASATFDSKNDLWKINGLRHLVTPRISYRYIPHAVRGRSRIPQIDRESFATYLQPLGLGDVRNIDDLRPTNTLRVGLDNVLQTRDPVYGSRDLLLLNVANDFRFARKPGERGVSEIHTELALMPTSWLQFDLYQSFAPQNFEVREFNSGLTLHDGEAWSLRFSNNFLRSEIADYLVDARVRLNERFDVMAKLHYDAREQRFNEQSYGLVQNLNNTWRLSYVVSLYAGPRRESRLGIDVRIEAIRF